ncbi:alpha-glucosidase [Virgibacillus pantothenticus]|uniref:Alpha-glucosidase n=1 Tax=Virgibacillus pantothenticus TaxID=1473 RepID=A0A0L0QM91_VIRPA|nr:MULTISPECIES: glycoside hydrolase family 31 protein [Virgibacillus]API93394.1 alpha-glucosidase [Virgibacillus sp. 6R]KNE19712.1 alpha-glucosidase [Virgibacillus pantothenticus]MBS7430241.1 glycoside hydrolase family 31 protein [Virgibacillus sp. 19R1-5]MBU8566203.1 glycoside hydrolase family 31 protein [Virgibacillus pantothenticus]MBU8602899.1 glycoside hydrolase family 31 protein [Virgibacillus pantothenticus]
MLEDTSFAIHPGNNTETEAIRFIDIGNLLDYRKSSHGYWFACDHGYVVVRFYHPSIVRIVMNPTSNPDLNQSQTVVAKPESLKITEQESSEWIMLQTEKLEVTISKQPFRIAVKDLEGRVLVQEKERGMVFRENGEVMVCKEKTSEDHFYGFGEKSGFLDKNGEKYEMWNSDVYAPHNPETDPLYQSIPFFMTLRHGKAHGIFFDNTFRTTFDMKRYEHMYTFSAAGGQVDYYVMAGPEPKAVLEQYTSLTGRMPIPAKWALGYHQSRYSYESEEEVRALAQKFIDRDIPVDVVHLDIHYMNGYRVFTFDKDRFSDPEKLIADLKDMGIRVVPIVDPGVKKDPEYTIYQEGVREDNFCKYLEGDIYIGEVWPGESAFPDFTEERVRKWWGDKHVFYTDMGVEGIWNDMNEPAVFNETKTMDTTVMHRNDGKPTTHRELHNVYGLLMGKATYEGLRDQLNGKRPFLLTRAGYAGVQRYATVWTGDNRSFWEHLQMSLPMVMNLGLSGIAFAGPDVGGFAHDTNPELLVRWTQVGAFTPYFRNHSAIGTLYQEPWQFGENHEAMIRKYIKMRYEWMPQLYTLFYQASKQGLPVMRPLLMEYPADEKTYNLNDQFMIGDNVMVAPILAPAVTDRAVYFPEGDWVDFFTEEEYHGGTVHLVHAELDQLPVFIKKGTAVVQGTFVSNKEKQGKDIKMSVYASQSDAKYTCLYYDDDGETFAYENGEYLKLEMEITSTSDQVAIDVTCKEGSYQPDYQDIKINVVGLGEGQRVIINGAESSNQTHIRF